jgi:hypothetical protein
VQRGQPFQSLLVNSTAWSKPFRSSGCVLAEPWLAQSLLGCKGAGTSSYENVQALMNMQRIDVKGSDLITAALLEGNKQHSDRREPRWHRLLLVAQGVALLVLSFICLSMINSSHRSVAAASSMPAGQTL